MDTAAKYVYVVSMVTKRKETTTMKKKRQGIGVDDGSNAVAWPIMVHVGRPVALER